MELLSDYSSTILDSGNNSPDPRLLKTDPLLTVDEVANYLRLKPSTVRAMARRGEIRAVKVGRVWRFLKSSVKEILQDTNITQRGDNA